MDNFMKQLEESGIKDSLMKALAKNPCADIAEILEYEISKNENLEDAFLSDALAQAVEKIIDAFGSVFNAQKNDKE